MVVNAEIQFRERIVTVPNILSFLRFLSFFPLLFFLSQKNREMAFYLILFGFLSDFLDGWIARRFHQTSNLGRVMDPLIDKLHILGVSTLLVVSPYYAFPLWYYLFLLVRESAVALGGLFLIKKKHITPESNIPGKRSAFLTGICIFFYLMEWYPYAQLLLWMAFFLSLYSSWIYLRMFWKIIKGQGQTQGR